MRIKCPYCYTPFTSSELCKTHCDDEHADELAAPLGKGFYIADYLAEEQIFQELKAEFVGTEANMAAIESRVDESLTRRQRLMALRLYICLWPCKHEGLDNEEEVDLTSCCDGRKYFGEFLNIMYDAYNSDCSDSE
jgi:hypothetical protein